MIKKIVAALLVVVMLTGCASEVNHTKENIGENNQVEESAEDHSEGSEVDKEPEMQTEESVEEEKAVESTKKQDEKVDKHRDDFKVEEIEISDDRFSLEELLSKDIGVTYMYSGLDGFKKVEKLIRVFLSYGSGEKYYEFMVLDYNDMQGEKPKEYSITYAEDFRGKGIIVGEEYLINEEFAVARKPWKGNTRSQLYGNISTENMVTKWDDEMIVLKVKAVGNDPAKVPEGYEEEYTFLKGKGITNIRIKRGLGEEWGIIAVNEMNESMRTAHQTKLWREIPKEYIEEVPGLNGYFQVKEEFFNKLISQLQIEIKGVSEKDKEKLFEEYLEKMPDYSLNAIGKIIDMTEVMYKNTGDEEYLFKGLREYERRVDEIDNTYKDDFSIPLLHDYEHFHRDYMTHKYMGIYDLEGEELIRVQRFQNNMIRINSEYDQERVYWNSEKFIKAFAKADISSEFKEYLRYKEFIYKEDNKEYIRKSKVMADVMSILEKSVQKKPKYEKSFEEVYNDLLKVETKNGKITRKYIHRLRCYLDKGTMSKYHSEISRMVELIDESRVYTKEFNDYLGEISGEKLSEEELRDLQELAEEKVVEEKLYACTKENYVELEEIDTSNAVEVWTADEFLAAIEDNAVIKVMDDLFIHSAERTISDKVNVSRWGVQMNEIDNLVIIGDGDYPINISVGSSDDAMNMKNCTNITFRNLSIGHTWNCAGPAMTADKGSKIKVQNSIIYGCGYVGFRYNEVEDIEIKNTLIWDCINEAINFYGVKGGELNNVIIRQNGINQPIIQECEDINEVNVQIPERW